MRGVARDAARGVARDAARGVTLFFLLFCAGVFSLGASDSTPIPAASIQSPPLAPTAPAPLPSAISKPAAGVLPRGFVDSIRAFDLQRFEIVTLGSFPITLFYADFSSDMYRLVAHGFDARYAPWPFKTEYSDKPSDDERWLRISAAVGLSVFVGVVDAIIHSGKTRARPRAAELDSAGTRD